jgi:hypothetical protein
MCQQRIETADGKKDYLPWTFWDDGIWRCMEPLGDEGLPLWKPALPDHERERKRYLFSKDKIMVHEGAKAARHVDWLLRSSEPEAQELRARHPWALELAGYEHWGWLGGAPNPRRTDWGEVLRANPSEVVIVADNDMAGQQAVTAIARALQGLQGAVMAIMFDESFPDHFDLADPFPKSLWHKDKYHGPRMIDCWCSATWATMCLGKEGKKEIFSLRPAFLKQWINSIKPKVFINRRYPHRLLIEEEFNTAVRPFSDVSNMADLLKQQFITQVAGIAYEPGRNQGIVTVEGSRCFNTWTPTSIPRRKGDVKPWLDFMVHLFPDNADRDRQLRWCATFIACPGIRIKFGILIISVMQGVGKGTLMEKVLAPLAGWQNVSVPNEKTLTDSSFNSWIARKRLVLVHEIYAGHSKKAYDNIKSAVTDTRLDINEKYLIPYNISNWAHFVLSSNSEYALRLVKNDRRWDVPSVTESKQTAAYWVEFNDYLVSGGLQAIHDWAYDYVEEHGAIDPADEAPSSAAKERLIHTSRSEGLQLVHDLGAMVAKDSNPVVLKDTDVRKWVATERGLLLSDIRLESASIIRSELKQAGLMFLYQGKTMGKRWYVFGNHNAKKKDNGKWEDLQQYYKDPGLWLQEEAAKAKTAGNGSGAADEPF